jgi:pimeloyl-ACP methyl ester carboxylesterase
VRSNHDAVMPRTIAELPDSVADRYPYESRFVQVNGWRMHYVDSGPHDATPVLLLHGNPAWGFLWRHTVVPLLAAGFRVIIPDQIGFGLSEKPHRADAHSLDNHASNLVALVDTLDLRGTVLVCHDWGGPTGLCALLTRPQRFAAVAVMSTWAWASPSAEFHHRVLPWRTMHAPLLGPYLLGKHGAMPGRGMYLSVVDRATYREEAQPAYEAVLCDPDERRLTWLWPRSIPLGLASDTEVARFTWLEQGVRELRLPATVIWGREDDVFAHNVFAAKWREIWPHAEGIHLVTGKHFLQEDSGREIGDLLVDFAARNVSR